jgi:hypothetical protein
MSKKDKNHKPVDATTTIPETPPVAATPTAPVKDYEPTEEQKTQLAEALAKGDFKTVTAISKAIASEQAKVEKSKREAGKGEEEAKKQLLIATTLAMKDRIVGLITAAKDKDSGDYLTNMDKADCVVFKWNFTDADNLVECKLFKSSATRPAGTKSTGGGAGKKYSVKTDELLAKYGENIFKDDTGQTFKEAWDSNSDGNWRYGIRVKLLKLEGVIK